MFGRRRKSPVRHDRRAVAVSRRHLASARTRWEYRTLIRTSDHTTRAPRTFRVFVSSTFSDLKAERIRLREDVWPRLRDLCEARGARFQAVDLRWGISEEAALDQQALNICLAEVQRCREISPRPNFVVLLGDPYGWCPAPPQIPADELEAILEGVDGDRRRSLSAWYQRDDNAVPPEYVLKRRTGRYADPPTWDEAERGLVAALRAGAPDPAGYSRSVTQLEIERGALTVSDAHEHVFCFFREIANIDALVADLDTEPVRGSGSHQAEDFVDLAGSHQHGGLDADAAARQRRLKDALRDRLGRNVEEYRVRWTGAGVSTAHIGHLPPTLDACTALSAEPLDPPRGQSLCVDVWRALSRVILAELGEGSTDPLAVEIDAHRSFGCDRASEFTGREDVLAEIASYLRGEVRRPLALHGASGCGKSALVARAAQLAAAEYPEAAVVRFVGITPASSDGRSLLASLCSEIATRLPEPPPIPDDYDDLVRAFERLVRAADRQGRLILFVDGLDQLDDRDEARRLIWLPVDLPARTRIVVSASERGPEAGDAAAVIDPLHVLRARIPSCLVGIPPMTDEEGSVLLDRWLTKAGRTLQPRQRDTVLRGFRRTRLPLYLKLAFEEARRWRSWADRQPLRDSVAGIIRDCLARLSTPQHHGEVLVGRSLACLAAARNGLSEDELLEVLSADRSDDGPVAEFRRTSPRSPRIEELPEIAWSRLHADLEHFLTTRSADGAAVMSFHHRQLRDVIEQDYLGGERSLRRHRDLARFFEAQELEIAAEPDPDATRGGVPNLRKMSELPYQQIMGELFGDLRSTLLSLEFLHAKTRAGLTNDVMRDFKLAGPRADHGGADGAEIGAVLTELAAAYNQESHAVLRRPAAAAQQIYNNVYAHGGALGAAGSILTAFAARRRYPGSAAWLRRMNSSPATITSRSLERTLLAHRGAVTVVSVSPDGRFVASGGADGAVRVWQRLDGALLASVEAHPGGIHALVWPSDPVSGLVASTGQDGRLRVWDWRGGIERAAWDADRRPVRALALVAGGEIIAAAGDGRTIRGFDGSGRVAWELRGHDDSVLCLTVVGTRLVSGSQDRTVRTWRLDPPRVEETLRHPRAAVRSLADDEEGALVVSGGEDRVVWTLTIGPARVLCAAEGHGARINGLASGVLDDAYGRSDGEPQGALVVSASDDETVRVWERRSGREVATLYGHTGAVNSVTARLGADWFASGGEDGTVRFWRSRRLREFRSGHTEHRAQVRRLVACSDGTTFASSSDDHTVKVWQRGDATLLATLRGHLQPVSALLSLPDGRLVSASADHTLKVWDVARRATEHTLGKALSIPEEWRDDLPAVTAGRSGHIAPLTCLARVGDRTIATAARDGTVILWDTETWEEAQLPRAPGGVEQILSSANGRWLVAITSARNAAAWDLELPGHISLLRGHTARLSSAALVEPDLLVTGGLDGTVRAWRLGAEDGATVWGRQPDWVTCIAVTPSGDAVLSGGKDGAIVVWDPAGGAAVRSLTGHEGPVRGLTFDASGRRLYSVADDQWLLAWDTANWSTSAATFIDGVVTTHVAWGRDEVCVGTRRGAVALFRLVESA